MCYELTTQCEQALRWQCALGCSLFVNVLAVEDEPITFQTHSKSLVIE